MMDIDNMTEQQLEDNINKMQVKLEKIKQVKANNASKNKNKKRAISGYLIFSRENYKNVREELEKTDEEPEISKQIKKVFNNLICIKTSDDDKDKVPDIEVYKQISRYWRNLDDSKKLDYNKMAKTANSNNVTK
tara:strand:+ start:102 stop:503 length:402 start_codon:yes stop_codon:yes gene_type:complete